MAVKASGPGFSLKRVGIDKTNSRILLVMSISAFLTIFMLVASWSLLGQLTFQNRVIKEKKKTVTQLKANLEARDNLVTAYTTFAQSGQNFLGGSATGNGAKDGNNAKLVLDALPSKYDFPALTASLEKLASEQKVKIDSIIGIDDEVAQQAKAGTLAPIEMPFEIKVTSDYATIQRLVSVFDLSIRPVQVKTLKLGGNQKEISLNITAQSFYQPEKKLELRTKEVK